MKRENLTLALQLIEREYDLHNFDLTNKNCLLEGLAIVLLAASYIDAFEYEYVDYLSRCKPGVTLNLRHYIENLKKITFPPSV